MYRKEIRHIQDMEESRQAVYKVYNYPVVKDAWSKVAEVYQRGKEGSRILRFCDGIAKTGASLAYQASQPVISKLPVELVNDYAVTKLDALEEKYPVIVKPTEEMVDAVKSYSSAKLEDAKSYGTAQFNRIAGVAGLGTLISVADSVVDALLPPVSTASDTAIKPHSVISAKEPSEPLTRVRLLNDKVKRRAYENAMSKAGAFKERSQEALSKLVHTVDLIEFAKSNMYAGFSDAKEKAFSLYEEVTEEGDEIEPVYSNTNFERKAICTARFAIRHARSGFTNAHRIATDMSSQVEPMMTDTSNYVRDLYHAAKDRMWSSMNHFVVGFQLFEKNYFNLSQYLMKCSPTQQKPESAPLAPVHSTSDLDDDRADFTAEMSANPSLHSTQEVHTTQESVDSEESDDDD